MVGRIPMHERDVPRLARRWAVLRGCCPFAALSTRIPSTTTIEAAILRQEVLNRPGDTRQEHRQQQQEG